MSRSSSSGKRSAIFSPKPRAALAPSPTLTARTANGRPWRLSPSDAMLGISSRQGVHHVAQKLSSTPLPRYSDRRCVLPCTSSSSSAGVAPPFHALSGCAAAGKASATRNSKASLIELLYRKKKARRFRRAFLSRGLLGVLLDLGRGAAGLRAAGLRAAGLLARLRLGGLCLLRVLVRFGLGFGLRLGLRSLRVGTQREGGREQRNKQFLKHGFSSVGKAIRSDLNRTTHGLKMG